MIVQREGERAKIISESRFPNEAELQRYVYENPEVLPISDIKEDARFTVLDKETPVGTGFIDILGVDSEGDLYIIETKLFSNSDKRKVLPHVLDSIDELLAGSAQGSSSGMGRTTLGRMNFLYGMPRRRRTSRWKSRAMFVSYV